MQLETPINQEQGSVRPTRSGKLRVALLGGLVVAVYFAAPSSVHNLIGAAVKANDGLRGNGARPLDLPVNVKASANPVLKLRKKVQSHGHDIKLGVDYDLMESSIDVEASTDARLFIKKLAGEETADKIGGEIALKADNVGNGDLNPRAEFRRKWLLPGIAGFKTKMEFLACADLAGASDAKVTFGLRNKAKNKVELERTLVGEELGLDDRVKVDLSTSLSYPDKMELGLDEVNNIRQKLEQANLEVDLDKIAICIDLD
jgi:hypothetical protein